MKRQKRHQCEISIIWPTIPRAQTSKNSDRSDKHERTISHQSVTLIPTYRTRHSYCFDRWTTIFSATAESAQDAQCWCTAFVVLVTPACKNKKSKAKQNNALQHVRCLLWLRRAWFPYAAAAILGTSLEWTKVKIGTVLLFRDTLVVDLRPQKSLLCKWCSVVCVETSLSTRNRKARPCNILPHASAIYFQTGAWRENDRSQGLRVAAGTNLDRSGNSFHLHVRMRACELFIAERSRSSSEQQQQQEENNRDASERGRWMGCRNVSAKLIDWFID